MSGGIRCSILMGCSCGAERPGLVGRPPLGHDHPPAGLPQPPPAMKDLTHTPPPGSPAPQSPPRASSRPPCQPLAPRRHHRHPDTEANQQHGRPERRLPPRHPLLAGRTSRNPEVGGVVPRCGRGQPHPRQGWAGAVFDLALWFGGGGSPRSPPPQHRGNHPLPQAPKSGLCLQEQGFLVVFFFFFFLVCFSHPGAGWEKGQSSPLRGRARDSVPSSPSQSPPAFMSESSPRGRAGSAARGGRSFPEEGGRLVNLGSSLAWLQGLGNSGLLTGKEKRAEKYRAFQRRL